MKAHTPGPWSYRCVGYGSHIEPSIGWVGYGSAHPKDEYIANARLIASAPDMLEALKNLLETCEYGDHNADEYNAAVAAIAKAKGNPQ